MIGAAIGLGIQLFQAVNSYQKMQGDNDHLQRTREMQAQQANRALAAQVLLGGASIAGPLIIQAWRAQTDREHLRLTREMQARQANRALVAEVALGGASIAAPLVTQAWQQSRRRQVARWADEDQIALATPEPPVTREARAVPERPPRGYPLDRVPGSMRRDLDELGAVARHRPLVVLVPSPSASAQGRWGPDLLHRVYYELLTYQHVNGDDSLLVWRADREFQWPHELFHAADLGSRPTIILQTGADSDRLDFLIAGCHLGPAPGVLPFPPRTAFTLWYRDLGDWDPAQAAHYERPTPADAAALTEINRELAARVAVVCVIAAVDSHHIMATPGYDELLDQAIDRAGKIADNWPADYRLPRGIAADPAYHALQCCARLLRRGETGAGRVELRFALALLAGAEPDCGTEQEPPSAAELHDLVLGAARGGLMHGKHCAKLLTLLAMPAVDPSGALAGLFATEYRHAPSPPLPPSQDPSQPGPGYWPDSDWASPE